MSSRCCVAGHCIRIEGTLREQRRLCSAKAEEGHAEGIAPQWLVGVGAEVGQGDLLQHLGTRCFPAGGGEVGEEGRIKSAAR